MNISNLSSLPPGHLGRTFNEDSHKEDISLNANTLKEELVVNIYQEEIGIFEKQELEFEAIVISQSWPSWSFALEGLGFCNIRTFGLFDNVTSREEFMSTEMGHTLITAVELKSLLKKYNDKIILFVQGDKQFLASLGIEKDQSNQKFNMIFVCSDPKFFATDSMRLSHKDVGGVTDGEWSYYIEGLPMIKVPKTLVVRNLSHVLTSTEGRSSSRALKSSEGSKLSRYSLVPWKTKLCQVETTSVYHKDELIIRLITYQELMDIYDIELLTQANLLRLKTSNSGSRPSLSFVNQVPVKVLRAIAFEVVKGIVGSRDNKEDDELSVLSSNSNNTLVHSNLNDLNDMDDISVTSLDNQSLAHEVKLDTPDDRAARPDDAEALVEDWDKWSVSSFVPSSDVSLVLVCKGIYDAEKHLPLFDAFRNLLIKRYRRNILQSLLRYLRVTHAKRPQSEYTFIVFDRHIQVSSWVKHRRQTPKKASRVNNLHRDLEVGRDAVRRAAWSTWWNWDMGSTLYFWRWPSNVRQSVRDGTKLFVDWDKMPRYMDRPRWPSDEVQREKLEAKIRKVREREYIQPGYVKSLTGFFAVPKAGTDIRVVYDATQCGLNDALWAPNFFLPTVDSILRNASASTWFGDIDLGEMFLNYTLDLSMQPYAGIDVTDLDLTQLGRKLKRAFERWSRTLMGFKPSPYICTQTFAWGEEIIIGDRLDITNPFYWDRVILNLPGTINYDPQMSVVYKWNSLDECLAAFFGTYIDDIRSAGSSEFSCRSTTHRIGCRINYLGQQDAVRKRGHAAKVPRAWAGAKCVSSDEHGLYVLTTEEKWKKAQVIIAKWIETLEDFSTSLLSYSDLEKDVGFLCHLSRTYPATFPYLKGFYNSLNSWRLDRNKDGWKIGRTAWMELLSGDTSLTSDEFMSLPFEVKKRKFFELNNNLKISFS